MHHDFAGPPSFAFGRFSVLPARRELIADGRRIEVGDRAFDVLLVLLEASGTIVSKDDLLGRVWPAAAGDDAGAEPGGSKGVARSIAVPAVEPQLAPDAASP